MKDDPSGSAHLIKPVHIVGQQVDYLACGGLPHGRATQAKWLKWEKDTESRIPTVIPSQPENIAKWSAFSRGFVWCQDEQDDAWKQGSRDPCSPLDDSIWWQPCLQGQQREEQETEAKSSTLFFSELGPAQRINECRFRLRSQLSNFQPKPKQPIKSRDIIMPTKVHIVKAMFFPVVMYWCESLTIKKAEHQRIDAFELWCWRRLLRVLWTATRSNQSILKEISPEYSLEGLMLKLKLQYLAAWCKELTHWERPWCGERLKTGEEGDDRGWNGWMASPTQWTWVWVNSGSWWWTGRPGVLQPKEV